LLKYNTGKNILMQQSVQLSFVDLGKQVIQEELHAIASLSNRLNSQFENACKLILKTQGRVVIIGMGKSGHIAKKIAATFASTGTPAFFVHPGEANHGDLGMITSKDTVIAISNSGETSEILHLLPLFTRLGIPLIALCGNQQSTLAKYANINLDVSVEKEACPLGLAPTSSTTATLVMGDALAVALLKVRGFDADDFALFHPGGSLGRRLLLRTRDLMHSGTDIPQVLPSSTVQQALVEMTNKRLGMTTIIDSNRLLQGVFTDGDLRRALDQNLNLNETKIAAVMNRDFISIKGDTLAAEALKIMQENKITCLMVTHENQQVDGIIQLHDILKAGIA
jgi:arabinose-5-phosphate isomerase